MCNQKWKFDDHVEISDSFEISDGVGFPENYKITKNEVKVINKYVISKCNILFQISGFD